MANGKSHSGQPIAKAAATAFDEPPAVRTQRLERAHRLLCDGISSVNSLATLYDEIQKARGGGAPKTSEQDLLRAMVLMAGATVDAATKRLIRDSLRAVAHKSGSAQREALVHIKRKILSDLGGEGGDRLAHALLASKPRFVIVDYIVEDTTGDSLQSETELKKVSKLLGLNPGDLPSTKLAFRARNQIIHEMDSAEDSGQPGAKNRRQRKKAEMHEYAKCLIQTAVYFVQGVDDILTPKPVKSGSK